MIADPCQPLLPDEARVRGLTYAAPMFVDVEYVVKREHISEEKVIVPKVQFLWLPVMIHSKYCYLCNDNENENYLGTCFVIDGVLHRYKRTDQLIIQMNRVFCES